MRLLADENVPRASVERLRAAGHDVRWIGDGSVGADDSAVLAAAVAEFRIVVTFDLDFGELIFAKGARDVPGVVLCRFVPATADEPGEILAAIVSRPDMRLDGRFTVVTRDHVRQRPIPNL